MKDKFVVCVFSVLAVEEEPRPEVEIARVGVPGQGPDLRVRLEPELRGHPGDRVEPGLPLVVVAVVEVSVAEKIGIGVAEKENEIIMS